jgi:hypothetical protein
MSNHTLPETPLPAKRTAAAVVLAASLSLFSAGAPALKSDTLAATQVAGPSVAVEAADLLATLPVKGRAQDRI